MKHLQTITPLIVKGYKTFKISDMIKSLEDSNIFEKLRQVQKDELYRIKKKYDKLGYLTKVYSEYIKNLYYNFVLNNFSFEDNNISEIEEQPQHIGLLMLNQL